MEASGLKQSLLLLFLLALISGCTSRPYVPLEDRYRAGAPVTQGVHTVRKGDTLFAIAWRYHRDYKDLARVNGIKWPYRIYPGQKIRLSIPTKTVTKTNKKQTSIPASSQVQRYKKAANDAKAIQEKVANQRDKRVDIAWSWPARGSVLNHFSSRGKVNKGISIAGKRGDPVFAAASGKVVYSGDGFVGYRNLIVIRHSKTFLSAYAHNNRLLVKEGQQVKAGEKIAEIGSTGATRDQLYFEIRSNGKPVDPMRYLPKR